MRFGVFMPKMRPNGRGFEFPSGQITIFPKKYTRNVKSMQNGVKTTVTVKERYSMTFYIDSTSKKRGFYAITSNTPKSNTNRILTSKICFFQVIKEKEFVDVLVFVFKNPKKEKRFYAIVFFSGVFDPLKPVFVDFCRKKITLILVSGHFNF
jgi:hypothetical protein